MRNDATFGYLATLPSFLLYFVTATVLILLFIAIYIRFTPYKEIALIRSGNRSAAIKLSGAVIGFTLPVASLVQHSINLVDMSLWGLIALVIQILIYQILRLVIRDLPTAIQEDRLSVGIFAGGMALAIGIINAACLTY